MTEIPVLRLDQLLMVTVQVELNDQSACDLQTSILEKIEEYGATGILIDISSLELVDTFISRVFSETARMAALMNAKTVIVGMQPAVALTLMEMGMELPDVGTAVSAELGLEALGYRLTRLTSPDSDATRGRMQNAVGDNATGDNDGGAIGT